MAIYVSGFICQDVIIEGATGLYSAIKIAGLLTVGLPPGADPKALAPIQPHAIKMFRDYVVDKALGLL